MFHSLELRAYAQAGLYLESPVLHIDCGDGRFAAALRDMFNGKEAFTGVDMNEAAIRQALRCEPNVKEGERSC